MLRLDLCDYSDTCIVVKGAIDLGIAWNNDMIKTGGPSKSCLSRISNTFIENAEDLSIIMPMHNLFEYCDNCSMTFGRFWNYYRDEVDNVDDDVLDSKLFRYKTKITGRKEARPDEVDASQLL